MSETLRQMGLDLRAVPWILAASLPLLAWIISGAIHFRRGMNTIARIRTAANAAKEKHHDD